MLYCNVITFLLSYIITILFLEIVCYRACNFLSFPPSSKEKLFSRYLKLKNILCLSFDIKHRDLQIHHLSRYAPSQVQDHDG